MKIILITLVVLAVYVAAVYIIHKITEHFDKGE
jgi:uncharacterized protein YxeA